MGLQWEQKFQNASNGTHKTTLGIFDILSFENLKFTIVTKNLIYLKNKSKTE